MENKTMVYRLESFNIHQIFEKEDSKECSTYRTIALISLLSIVTLKVIQQRLLSYIEQEMPDVQAAFRKGRGHLRPNCQHSLYAPKNFKRRLVYELQTIIKPLHRSWKAMVPLKVMGVTLRLIFLICNLYCRQEATVRIEYGNRRISYRKRCQTKGYIIFLFI